MTCYVLSTRECQTFPSYGVVVELEDILLASAAATLLAPKPNTTLVGRTCWAVFRRDLPPARVSLRHHGTPSDRSLFCCALTARDLTFLDALPGWRRHFGMVAAYIFDPWWPLARIPGRILRSLDRVFVPDDRIADRYRRIHGAKAEAVPLATDVLGMGSATTVRPLDVVAYGRQDPVYLQPIVAAFNAPSSDRIVYHDTVSARPTNLLHVADFPANRRLIWNLLRKSRVALAFKTSSGGRHRDDFIPIRYYEAAAAGTVIVGRHSSIPEMHEQFGWTDSTIELPESPADAVPFLESLLADTSRLDAIHRRNHREARRRHDWRHRLRDMFLSLGLPLPERLRAELAVLSTAHAPGEP